MFNDKMHRISIVKIVSDKDKFLITKTKAVIFSPLLIQLKTKRKFRSLIRMATLLMIKKLNKTIAIFNL